MNKILPGITGLLLLLVGAVAFGASQSVDQTSAPALSNQQMIRQELGEMIQRAIKQATAILPGGVKASTIPLLSIDDYEKARRFGDGATTVLTGYLKSPQFFEQLLAIRLLAYIGTDASKDALDDFAEKAELTATRSYVLDFIVTNGRRKDIEVLQRVATLDSNTQVRARAIELLQRYKTEHDR